MKKIKVIIFGTRPLSIDVYNLIKKSKHFNIVGVVTKKPGKNAWWKKDLYYENKNSLIKEKNLKEIKFDLGVSINWEKLIKKEILKIPKYGFINIHNSYLNILRCRNIFFHCLCGDSYLSNSFGCTLHLMNEQFDDGKIIMSKRIKIGNKDTSWDLYNKFNSEAKKIFKKYLASYYYLENFKKYKKQKTFYFKKKLNLNKNFSNLKLDMDFYNKVRALSFPGFKPAYSYIKNKKNYLFIKKNKNRKLFKTINLNGNMYKIYYSKNYL